MEKASPFHSVIFRVFRAPMLTRSIKLIILGRCPTSGMFLGIDCGTQSLKVLAWDPERGFLDSVSREYGLIEDLPPGHKEQHPQMWIDALEESIAALQERRIEPSKVQAIGVSGQQHGLVVLDSGHQVIRPAKLWNDTSTEPQCRKIIEAAGGFEAYHQEIGNGLPPGFTASKILWIKENELPHYEEIRHLLLPHDYLNFYLTGEMTAEAGDASGTGYFQVRERRWSQRALSWIDSGRDLSGCLPRLIDSHEPAGQLRPELAKKWGMNANVTVSSGGGDNMMGAIGSGNVRSGAVTMSLGTSGTIYGYSDCAVVDPSGEIAAFCDSTGGWLPLGCTMNVTVATEMIRTGIIASSLDGFNRLVEQVPAGAGGLILLPYLEGERMPNVPEGTGVLLGLRHRTATPAYLARAAMEGATLGLYYAMERLTDLGIAPAEIRLIGGGAKSPVWRQVVADIVDLPVVCPCNQEGAAFGAALQAMWCGQGGNIADLADVHVALNEGTRHEPVRANQELYRDLYQVYKKLSETLVRSGVFTVHRHVIERKD